MYAHLYILLCFGSFRDPPTPSCTKVYFILLCFGRKFDHPPPKWYFCTEKLTKSAIFSKIPQKNSKKIQKKFKKNSKKIEEFFKKNWETFKNFSTKIGKIFDFFFPNLTYFCNFSGFFTKILYKSTNYTFVILEKM